MKLSATVGATDDISAVRIGTFTMDPPNILAGGTGDVTATVSGLDAASNWIVCVNPVSTLSAGIGVSSAWVSADNTITVRFANVTILAINQGSATFAYLCIK